MPHDAQLAAGMAIGSILSLLMLSAVLLRKCCIGRRHHKHAKVLLVGTASQLLLGSQFGGACFNAVCVFQWLTDAQGETQWLRDFGVCASGFYFLALAWHLLSTTRSPFAPPSTLPLHAMANACAIVAATLAAMLEQPPALTAAVVLPAVLAAYTLAAAVLLSAARLARTTRQEQDVAFSLQHVVVTRGLRTILLVEACYVLLEAVGCAAARGVLPGVAADAAPVAAFGVLAGLQDAVVAAAWLLVHRRAFRTLRRGLGAHGDAADAGLAPGLRRQLVHLIAVAVCDSVEQGVEEAARGAGAGELSAAECLARGEYARTVTSVVARPSARSSGIEVRPPLKSPRRPDSARGAG